MWDRQTVWPHHIMELCARFVGPTNTWGSIWPRGVALAPGVVQNDTRRMGSWCVLVVVWNNVSGPWAQATTINHHRPDHKCSFSALFPFLFRLFPWFRIQHFKPTPKAKHTFAETVNHHNDAPPHSLVGKSQICLQLNPQAHP